MVWMYLLAAIKHRPQLLNCVTGCVLLSGSDAIAQELEHRCVPNHATKGDNCSLDFRRVMTTGLVGMFIGGFVYPTAYAKLDAIFPGRQVLQVVQKSVVEIFTVGIFVNSVSMFQEACW
jgi:hypothetical protein